MKRVVPPPSALLLLALVAAGGARAEAPVAGSPTGAEPAALDGAAGAAPAATTPAAEAPGSPGAAPAGPAGAAAVPAQSAAPTAAPGGPGASPEAPEGDTAEPVENVPGAGADAAAKPRAARRAVRSASERWVRFHVPDELERAGALGLEWWQWLALPLLALVSAGTGRLAGGLTSASLRRLTLATPALWDDDLLDRGRGPLNLALGVGAAAILADFVFLRAPAAALLTTGLRIGLLVAILWVALRAVEIAGEAARKNALLKGNSGAVSVLPLVVRASKIGLVALGVVTVLSALGYPVTSLLAGLGIGGLALALAAQKTAENVFGSVSIGVDQPFRVGDLVKIEDFFGVVERIGLRSTSIRTQDRTLVTLPNGRLADMRVENFSVRDRMRIGCTLGLVYGTPSATLRAVNAAVEQRLRAHPAIWPDLVQVRLTRLAASSVDIDVSAWFVVSDPDVLAVIRDELLLGFLEDIEAAGAQLAFPTQTIHVAPPSA